MSKTKRRRNIPDTFINHGLWGYFTKFVYSDGFCTRVRLDKIKNPEAWNSEVRRLHAESDDANHHTPGRWYRKRRENQLRGISKRELQRFKMDIEHEVIIQDEPNSHLWDWR